PSPPLYHHPTLPCPLVFLSVRINLYFTPFLIVILSKGILFHKKSHNEFHHAIFRYALNYFNSRLNQSFNPAQPSGHLIHFFPLVSQIDSDNPFHVIQEREYTTYEDTFPFSPHSLPLTFKLSKLEG